MRGWWIEEGGVEKSLIADSYCRRFITLAGQSRNITGLQVLIMGVGAETWVLGRFIMFFIAISYSRLKGSALRLKACFLVPVY